MYQFTMIVHTSLPENSRSSPEGQHRFDQLRQTAMEKRVLFLVAEERDAGVHWWGLPRKRKPSLGKHGEHNNTPPSLTSPRITRHFRRLPHLKAVFTARSQLWVESSAMLLDMRDTN